MTKEDTNTILLALGDALAKEMDEYNDRKARLEAAEQSLSMCQKNFEQARRAHCMTIQAMKAISAVSKSLDVTAVE